MLEFNWYLGHDISEIMRTRIWGSGVINQVSLDLKEAFPEAKGFSKDNLYRMGQFYRFYSEQKEIVAQVVPQIKDTLVVSADSRPTRCLGSRRRAFATNCKELLYPLVLTLQTPVRGDEHR